MLDRRVLVDKEKNTIKFEGSLKEVLEQLEVKLEWQHFSRQKL